MSKFEFGIIENFENDKWYSKYEPEKYNCVSVNDDTIDKIMEGYHDELAKIKTYFQTKSQEGRGIDYAGVTLIPPESLEGFLAVIKKANERLKDKELEDLVKKINEAKACGKHIICYGL
ncbi:MAG: hypothetical protein GX196_02985 [Clostridiaceae bacterium]|nr:hypothetical protein [Clostridiaceae bacterium]